MRLAIMQPYFFPYIGYWQLINAVDKFVIYDDVSYIKQGWINRNKIIINGESRYITLPLVKASSNKKINEIKIASDGSKLIKTIEMNYKKAPYFNKVMPIIADILDSEERNLSDYLINSIKMILDYLKIERKLYVSSELAYGHEFNGQDRVLEICEKFKAIHYINPIGGQSLYSKELFKENGIELSFLKPDTVQYPQFEEEFIPNLSIIDILMFNSVQQINNMLNQYELV